jgi:AraC-like DNA-binding protein
MTEGPLSLRTAAVVLETAVQLGAERAALLEGTGFDEAAFADLGSSTTYEHYDALVDNALRLTGEPMLGAIAGRNMSGAQLGVIGLEIVTSLTVAQAIEAWLSHVRVISPAWEPALEVRGDVAYLVLGERHDRGAHRVFATELILAALEANGRWLLGSELPVQRLLLAFPRPPHAARYAEFTSVPPEFDAPVTEVQFDAAILERPVAFADPATHRLAQELVALEPATNDVVSRIRGLVHAPLGQPPTVEELARALHATPSEIRLALQRAGTSYRRLVEEWRARRARELAVSTQLPVAEIATRVGFRSPRSFRRAFKRWTGQSPEALRHGERPVGTPR